MVGCCLLAGACSDPQVELPLLGLAYPHGIVSPDPHASDDEITRAVLAAVYEPLVCLGPGAGVRPCVAHQWTTPSDTLWQFTIRPGITFHDGRPVTPADVLWSLERARRDPGSSALATYLESISEVSSGEGSDAVIEIRTASANPLLLPRLASVAIMPREADPQKPVGTGPYVWESASLPERISLRRWEGYWGEKPDAIEVSVLFPGDDARIWQLLDTGEIDVVSDLTGSAVDIASLGEGWRTESVSTVGTTMLGFSVLAPPLDDPRVRRAVDLAINRDDLARAVDPSEAATGARHIVPAEAFGFNPDAMHFDGSITEAIEPLDELDFDHSKPIELAYTEPYQLVADELLGRLTDLGLSVTPVRYEYDLFYRGLEEGFPGLFVLGWSFRFADASDFLDGAVHTRDEASGFGLLNGSGYSNPRLDRLLDAATKEVDSTIRLEYLKEVLSVVAQDRPYIPLVRFQERALLRRPLKVVRRSSSAIAPQDVGIPRD